MIIYDWDDFEDWRKWALLYASYNGENSYYMAWNWFRIAREYYEVHGFKFKREYYKGGQKKGQLKPPPPKERNEHSEERLDWIGKTLLKKGLINPKD